MSDLFIVENGDENWKAKGYLHEWADFTCTFDDAVLSGWDPAARLSRTQYTSEERRSLFAATHGRVRVE